MWYVYCIIFGFSSCVYYKNYDKHEHKLILYVIYIKCKYLSRMICIPFWIVKDLICYSIVLFLLGLIYFLRAVFWFIIFLYYFLTLLCSSSICVHFIIVIFSISSRFTLYLIFKVLALLLLYLLWITSHINSC